MLPSCSGFLAKSINTKILTKNHTDSPHSHPASQHSHPDALHSPPPLIPLIPTLIPHIPTLIPYIPTPNPGISTLIPCILTLIPWIPTLIRCIPTPIHRIPTLILCIPCIPCIPNIPNQHFPHFRPDSPWVRRWVRIFCNIAVLKIFSINLSQFIWVYIVTHIRGHSHIGSSHSLRQNDAKLQTQPPSILNVKMLILPKSIFITYLFIIYNLFIADKNIYIVKYQ